MQLVQGVASVIMKNLHTLSYLVDINAFVKIVEHNSGLRVLGSVPYAVALLSHSFAFDKVVLLRPHNRIPGSVARIKDAEHNKVKLILTSLLKLFVSTQTEHHTGFVRSAIALSILRAKTLALRRLSLMIPNLFLKPEKWTFL